MLFVYAGFWPHRRGETTAFDTSQSKFVFCSYKSLPKDWSLSCLWMQDIDHTGDYGNQTNMSSFIVYPAAVSFCCFTNFQFKGFLFPHYLHLHFSKQTASTASGRRGLLKMRPIFCTNALWKWSKTRWYYIVDSLKPYISHTWAKPKDKICVGFDIM